MKTPTVTQRPDGRWQNGTDLLFFGLHLNHIPTLGPVHVFHENSVGRSVCGKVAPGHGNYVFQTAFPRNHPVCRQCNYSLHFGTYGDTLTTRQTT